MDEYPVAIPGERVLLRDPRPDDMDARLRWVTVEREWGYWDAPWEGNEPVSPDRVEEVRRRMTEDVAKPLPTPRSQLYVERIDGPLLGWVNHYGLDLNKRITSVGVDICESAFWGQGLGTEALQLWVGYLFTSLDLCRIETATWSGNERMIRCAAKCGFILEERISEAREVRGQRYDAVRFGLSREQWAATCQRDR
jgi:RimJ/RimL family protein N-acetyltransferase